MSRVRWRAGGLAGRRYECNVESSWRGEGDSQRSSCGPWASQVRFIQGCNVGYENWRREGDSNPRYRFWQYNDLANRRLQPLGHLSAVGETHCPSLPEKPLRETLSLATRVPQDFLGKNGAPWRIRTTGLLIRSQMLYPAELRARARGRKVANLQTLARQLAPSLEVLRSYMMPGV